MRLWLDRLPSPLYNPGVSPRDISEGSAAVAIVPATAARPKPSLFLLVAMTGLGPFTMQIVIPSMPAMAAALTVPYGTVQLTLTVYLIGVALGQLLYGPLSDRYGRKPLLLAGLGLYLLGSAAAAVAPSAGLLILARALQAAGGCAGLVLGRAMVRDAYPRDRAASVIGYVSTAMAVAPMVSPLLGSVLTEHLGWRSTMLTCLAIGVPLWFAMRVRLPETLVEKAPLPGLTGMLGAYVQLLRLPAFRAYCGVVAFSTGVFFAFAAGTPLVVVNGMGHPPTHLAAAMMLLAISWSCGTFTTARLSVRLGVPKLLRLGTALILAGGVLAVLLLALRAAEAAAVLPADDGDGLRQRHRPAERHRRGGERAAGAGRHRFRPSRRPADGLRRGHDGGGGRDRGRGRRRHRGLHAALRPRHAGVPAAGAAAGRLIGSRSGPARTRHACGGDPWPAAARAWPAPGFTAPPACSAATSAGRP